MYHVYYLYQLESRWKQVMYLYYCYKGLGGQSPGCILPTRYLGRYLGRGLKFGNLIFTTYLRYLGMRLRVVGVYEPLIMLMVQSFGRLSTLGMSLELHIVGVDSMGAGDILVEHEPFQDQSFTDFFL